MQLEVIKVIQETPTTRTLRLKPEQAFDYLPGKFIIVKVPVKQADGTAKVVQRSYSIANAPGQGYVEITFNVHPEGAVTPTLYNLKVGEKVEALGPFGVFTVDASAPELVFIAAGTGISPLAGFTRQLAGKAKLTLLYSVKTEAEMIFRKEFEALAAAGKLRFFPTVSRPEESPGWKGHTGRIDAAFVQACVPDVKRPVYYICGPPAMVPATVELLKGIGVPAEHIKIEAW